MSSQATAYFTHPDCVLHEMGPGHPEQPARIAAVEDRLKAAGLYDFLLHRQAGPARFEQLAHAHDHLYLDELAAASPKADQVLIQVDPDTAMNRHSLDAAAHAAGAAVAAVDTVLAGEARSAFCNTRPPGHHAERHQAMGFCFYNSVAIAAYHALQEHALARVAIVDFDVHYGNGTADIVAGDERILLCSSYQFPLYPLSAPATQADNFSNILLPPGADSAAFREAVAARWLPDLAAFQPQLVLFSAGFDAHAEDPLAELRLREDDFAWVTRQILKTTAASAGLRAVSTLEGGYNLSALGRSAAAHIQALMEPDEPA